MRKAKALDREDRYLVYFLSEYLSITEFHYPEMCIRDRFRPEYVSVAFESAVGRVAVCEKGAAIDFDEALAKQVLS